MLKIRNGRLPSTVRTKLAEYQRDVNARSTYPERVGRAKKKFKGCNTKRNRTFAVVRRKLAELCGGIRRCMYCEDSVADEVEHFKPKDLYPQVVFAWRNYLYSCGQCNGGKNNRFSVIEPEAGGLVDVTRPRDSPVTPPPRGDAALIDPRRENPLDFIILDLRETFAFTPFADAGTVEHKRAEYTIDILRLNERDYLREARRNAMVSYAACLARYVELRNGRAPAREVAQVKSCIQGSPHPTVWAEMQRQHGHHDSIDRLFHAAPEALDF